VQYCRIRSTETTVVSSADTFQISLANALLSLNPFMIATPAKPAR
jgi:hypothetical protein